MAFVLLFPTPGAKRLQLVYSGGVLNVVFQCYSAAAVHTETRVCPHKLALLSPFSSLLYGTYEEYPGSHRILTVLQLL